MWTRRRFLAVMLGAAGGPSSSLPQLSAQPSRRIFRLASLSELPRFPLAEARWRRALQTRGYVEGKTVTFDFRWGDGRPQTLKRIAAELVATKPDVILTTGTPAALAAKETTSTIPIVTHSSDPIGERLVATLSRPGANVTGVFVPLDELATKRVQFLNEIVPHLRTVAIVSNPTHPTARSQAKSAEAAARMLRISSHRISLMKESDVERAFAEIVAARADGIVLTQEAVTFQAIPRIAEAAAKNRLPASHAYREFADAGGLMAYGVNLDEVFALAAFSVDRILTGANPAQLPVQQPTKFELVINLKTAKALGLTIPSSLLTRADEIIE